MKNEKGFTLFTAIVSFIIIGLAILIVQNMLNVENTSVNIIQNIQDQSEMQAIADTTRADALQLFNLNVRLAIVTYLTSNEFPLRFDQDWTSLVNDFQYTYFGAGFKPDPSQFEEHEWCKPLDQNNCELDEQNNPILIDVPIRTTTEKPDPSIAIPVQGNAQLASYISDRMEILIDSVPSNYKEYKIELIIPDVTTKTSSQDAWDSSGRLVFRNLMKKVLAVEKNEKVIDLEGCDPTNIEKCKGFYIDLNFTKLSLSEFEQLPKIRVTNSLTKRTIEKPVLPYGTFKLLVPIRLFEAMARTSKLAHKPDATNADADDGILSLKFHNTLEEMRLGVCDAGKCGYRTNPFDSTSTNANLENSLCMGSAGTTGKTDKSLTLTGATSSITYDPFSESDTKDALEKIAQDEICKLVISKKNYLEQDARNQIISGLLELQNITCTENILVETENITSKIIIKNNAPPTLTGANPRTGTFSFNVNNACRSIDGPVVWKGINSSQYNLCYKNSDDAICTGTVAFDYDEFAKIKLKPARDLMPPTELISGYSYCSEINRIDITLKFKETNTDYIVDKKQSTPTYVFKIVDQRFSLFNPLRKGSCSTANTNVAFNQKAWTCMASVITNTGESCIPAT